MSFQIKFYSVLHRLSVDGKEEWTLDCKEEWTLECKEEWTLDSFINLGWIVKTKPMQEDVSLNTRVTS